MKILKIPIIWDVQNDYYYSKMNDTKISIMLLDNDSLHIQIINKNNSLVTDEILSDINQLKLILEDMFKTNISVPSIEALKRMRL